MIAINIPEGVYTMKTKRSIIRFKSKIILPKKGYLIKIKFLTQVLEKIATPGYILSERSGDDSHKYSSGII